MYVACNVGKTINIRSRMNGHKSDYRRFLNFLIIISKSNTSSLCSHLKSHDIEILKFEILEIVENEDFNILKTFAN